LTQPNDIIIFFIIEYLKKIEIFELVELELVERYF
jgi:hypothetical protein